MRSLPIDPRTLIAITLLVAGAVIGMSSILAWVGRVWYSFFGQGVYSHGYLVLGLSIWMGWTFWRRNPPRRIAPAWSALGPLVLLVLAMAAMELLYIGATRAMLLPLLFLASVALVFGYGAARVLLLPALFMYSALLPFWMFNPILQDLATGVVGLLMNVVDVPFLIEGNFVHIPAGTFEIASGCSGLSFLVSGTILAVYFSAMYLRSWPHRILLVVAAAGAAFFANWMRIWTLILIGHATELQHWLIEDHLSYGWVLFIIFFVPVLFLAHRLEKRELLRGEHAGGGEPAERRTPAREPSAGPMILAAMLGAILLATPRVFTSEISAANAMDPLPLPLPARVAGGAVATDEGSPWRPHYSGARQGFGVYQFDGGPVEVFRGVYPAQDRDHHLFKNRRSLFGPGWRPTDHQLREVQVGPERLTLNEYTGYFHGRERIIWAWYEIAGRPAATRLGAKLVEAQAFFSGRNDGVVIALSAECTPGCEQVRARFEDFLAEGGEELRWQPGRN